MRPWHALYNPANPLVQACAAQAGLPPQDMSRAAFKAPRAGPSH
jgi:hypothetical protein